VVTCYRLEAIVSEVWSHTEGIGI